MSAMQGEPVIPGVTIPDRSSVKVKTTAKGEAMPEVSAYEGTTEAEMARLSDVAVKTYLATREALVGSVVLA